MLAVALFGTVSGLEVRTFGKLPLLVQEAWIEWPIAEVALSDAPTLYVTRQATPSGIVTWIGLYKSAREMGGERRGGYLGAGVWLLGKAVGSAVLLEYLQNLVVQVEALATVGGQFVRRLSDIEGEVDWQEEMGRAVSTSLRDVQPGGGLRAADLPRVLVDSAVSDLAAHFLDLVQDGPGFCSYRGAVISTLAETTASARRLGRMRVVEFRDWAGSVVSQLLEQNRKLDAATGTAVRADEAVKSLHSQLAETRKEMQDWQSSSALAQQELAKSRTALASSQTSASDLSRQVHHLQESLIAVRAARDGLQTKSDQLAQDLWRLNNPPQDVAAEREELRRQLKAAESSREFWKLQAEMLSNAEIARAGARQGHLGAQDEAEPSRRQMASQVEWKVSTARNALFVALGAIGMIVIQPLLKTSPQKQEDAALPMHSQANTASAPQGAASTTQVLPMPEVVPGQPMASIPVAAPTTSTTTTNPSTSRTTAPAVAKTASESTRRKATSVGSKQAPKLVRDKAPLSANEEQPSERVPAAAPKHDAASAPAGPKTDGP